MPETVKVDKTALLAKLRENRDGHRGMFLEALEGFREEVTQQLEKALKDARAGRRYRTEFRLPEPQDHTRDYNRVIEMLEMSVDDVVELDRQEFAQFVQDDWGWRPDFLALNQRYKKS